jgi:2-methylcitrate dehydratase PrpD
MAHHSTQSKRFLSHVIAEWACALKYEHLSAEAIQAAKLFWFDSIGCARVSRKTRRSCSNIIA